MGRTPISGDVDLVSMADAAEQLGIHRETAYQLARTGRFPGDAAIRIGESWRVSLPKLRRYLHGEEVA